MRLNGLLLALVAAIFATPQVRASDPATVTRVIAMLHEWRFRPVLRGNAAIEVNAIVGFNIDTR